MSGQILTHADLKTDVERTCDVCIIGSGAGGAVLAAGLTAAGLRVVMLEEGSHVTRQDFTLREGEAFPAMYQERGTRGTSDTAITILQGRSVGGSTTVNWTTCFRTPERILDHWKRVHGIDGLDALTLTPHFDAVEERLSIRPWPASAANPNNQVIFDGCTRLGWESNGLRRNVKGCANSGYCSVGCKVDGKQAMGITYLRDAVASGLELFANVSVSRIEVQGGRAVAVHAQVMSPLAGRPDGARVTIRPKVVVSSAGAINGPALLLRSGITAGGRVGRRTFLHPVVPMVGEYERPIEPWQGAPQSAGSHQFIDRGPDAYGYFIEAAPLQPMIAAVAFNRWGGPMTEFMARLGHVSGIIALCVDGLLTGDEGGTVSVRSDGRAKLDYAISPRLTEAFRHATVSLAKIHLAAGVKRALSTHMDNVLLTSEADLPALEAAPYGAHEHAIFSAHQMGGCAMGATKESSVVNNKHQSWEIPNLFVVDGSVLPTALGVNPSETVYALAHRATEFVAGAV